MNTVELTEIMDNITCNVNFLGVLASDHFPKEPLTDLPTLLICNADRSDEPGRHWLAMYIDRNGVGCFFDSFGNPPYSEFFPSSILEFLKNNSTRVHYSTRQVQDFTSVTCGQHCVFFLYHISRGVEYKDIMKFYHNDNLLRNDTMVSLFVKKCKPMVCVSKRFKCIQCVQSGKMFQSY